MNSFAELTLSPALQENLARNKFISPTPVQSEAIPPALAGKDVLATAQTGTGKTLAFLIPVLDRLVREPAAREVKAVILVPTRELAMQVVDVFQTLSRDTQIRAALVVGGLSEHSQLAAIRKGAQVVIATPGRLVDFLQRKLVRLGATSMLVLDEADRMLDMGFRPAIRTIMEQLPTPRQTLFFCATLEKAAAELVGKHLNAPVRIAIGSISQPAGSIDLRMYEVEQDQKMGLLQHMLGAEQGSFLVFARTKHGVDRLADRLERAGVGATRIHGNRSQAQRNAALHGFRQGRFRVLVATDVAARGIHVENVSHVVNYDLPQEAEDFVHRAGRTGRASASGTATTFVTRGERRDIRRIEEAIQTKIVRMPAVVGLEREQREPASGAPHTRQFSSRAVAITAPAKNAAGRPNSPYGAPRPYGSKAPRSGKPSFSGAQHRRAGR